MKTLILIGRGGLRKNHAGPAAYGKSFGMREYPMR